MPGLRNGQLWRITSPSGGSTLITSAPKSARICVAYGPITTVVRSRTRTPVSGPAHSASHSGWMPASLAIFAHLAISELDEAAELRRDSSAPTSVPRLAKRAATSGLASAFTVVSCSR